MNSIDEEFSALCDQAMQAYGENLMNISFESALIDILDFVKKNPSHRVRFVHLFKDLLNSKGSPSEIVAFCMRELRWPEIKDCVIEIMSNSSDPRVEALRSVVAAYDEEWPDSDLYEYYSN